MSKAKFSADEISDQKRLVRGEHVLLAMNLLRIEHGHFGPRRILMLAGGEPQEEIKCLRECFRAGCHITCVDTDNQCLERSIDAGADDVLNVDMHSWQRLDTKAQGDLTRNEIAYPVGIGGREYELIDLDFCGGMTEQVRDTVKAYSYLLSNRGIMMVTFSYGRDVVERFIAEARHDKNFLGKLIDGLSPLVERGIAESLIGRILFLLRGIRRLTALSALCYRGKQMPMCGLLFQMNSGCKRRLRPAGCIEISTSDYSAATIFPPITMVDPCDLDYMFAAEALPNIYASPQERIELARRKFSAAKAVSSYRGRLAAEQVALGPRGSDAVA